MTQDAVIDIIQQAVMTVILVSAPPLLMGLGVGVLVSIFQTITSIQEPTLAFVPKILAVLLSLIIFGYFMLTTLQDYVMNLFQMIPTYLTG
ncbi:flagellar biosynthesis protein FliQ [Anaeropeptidivorans aminofermentans]|jgi:flagellar biosynthetic protein FliQ|uniref:flagellar biosynthesis protein FliQ n=1 Tax=Anaeropeptidivorans aminofermentans TaxID=2934315 RepID=UPI0020243C1B|nr:flagellar biosynthesis protein FliQ [Anaeropeptidivorans aminofermentans]MBE6011937.1 flagellar biosynthesis protein FliQ [Lachnospiraceae bacterium]